MSDTIAKLRELLLSQSKAGRLSDILDQIYGAAQTGAEAYGSANSPMAPEHNQRLIGLLGDLTPVVGDVKSAYEGVQAAREGDWLGAGGGLLGALPFVPNVAGWTVHKLSGGTKVIENPTREQALNLAKQSKMQELRAIRDKDTGKLYVWDAYDAIHEPVAHELGLNFDRIRDQTSRYAESYGLFNIPSKSIEGYPLKMFSGD